MGQRVEFRRPHCMAFSGIIQALYYQFVAPHLQIIFHQLLCENRAVGTTSDCVTRGYYSEERSFLSGFRVLLSRAPESLASLTSGSCSGLDLASGAQ